MLKMFGPWLAPFVVLLVTLFLYFYAARGSRRGAREAMIKDINFYLVAVIATAIVSIFAGYRIERDWLDVAAWLIAAVAVAGVVWRFMAIPGAADPAPEKEPGPLERNDRR